MKKVIPFLLILIINLSLISAINLEVKEKSINNVIISELSESAKFELEIINLNETDSFKIFSYIVDIIPKDEFEIAQNEGRTIEIIATPSEKTKKTVKGNFLFEYRIAGTDPGTFKGNLRIKLVPLAEIIEITPSTILPGQSEVELTIKNLEDKQLDGLILEFNSKFFEKIETFSLKPYEKITLKVPIDKNIQNLEAGQYVLETGIQFKDIKSTAESEISYLEQSGISTKKNSLGFIAKTTKIEKKNEGNVPAIARIEENNNILTRLFTTYSEVPLSTERKGLTIDHIWERTLRPNESFILTINRNYTIPIIILILFVVIISFVIYYLRTDLVLKKRISFVRTKGGEFALRVRIKAKARKNMENINLTDWLPAMTKIHEKYGTKPDHIDEQTRKISWHINSLNAGEERAFSYLIYSKLKVVGKFELPSAHASYKSEGKMKSVNSNRTSFAAEGS